MTLAGHILTPEGFVRGRLQWADGRIAALDGDPVTEMAVRADTATPIVLPGFVDLHVHGGAGADTMEGGDAVLRIAGLHARHGTTSLLATTMTAPWPDIERALRALARACLALPPGAARVLGVHLEGPYISPDKLGAQPAHTQPVVPAALEDILALHAIAPLRVITMATESPDALALIPALVQAGIRVQIGHTAASYEQAAAALAEGASSFTHLFNAMGAFHHRSPGAVGAALALARHAEIIPDLLHVHPGALHAALRAIPGLYCVTDATSASGMPDGAYRLGEQTVHKCLGGVRLADGTLAGSALTMDHALRNLVAIGLPLSEASARVSRHAADYLGLSDRGRLAPGAWADFVVLDAGSLAVRAVHVEGAAVADIPA
jgi:N-acetylglucosamine-6-phosphate deacetylase